MFKRSLALTAMAVSMVAISSSVAMAQRVSMTISTGVDPGFAVFYVGDKAGIFAKHGLDVKVTTGASGSATVPLLISNDSQAAMGGESAGINNFIASNGKVVLIAEASLLKRYYSLVSLTSIKTVDTLKGKRVGIARGTGSDIYWFQFLKGQNLKESEFKVVELEAPEMIAAMDRGDIDSYSAWEPWVTRGVLGLRGKAHVLVESDDSFAPRNMVYMNKDWIEKNPDAAKRFITALLETNEYILNNRDKAAAATSEFLKMDPALTSQLFQKVDYNIKLDDKTMVGVKNAHDQLKAQGKLARPLDWKSYVHSDLLKSVDAAKVKYTLPE
jgi:NitT/TauT family transport system substrate-binding protein